MHFRSLEILSISEESSSSDKLVVNDITTLIGKENSHSPVYFAMGFENKVLDVLVDIMLEGETVDEEEEIEMRESVAGEVANQVVGYALVLFPKDKLSIKLTPPITIYEEKDFILENNSNSLSSTIQTSIGEVTINVVRRND